MIDYQVEVWDCQKRDWYLIKAFRHTNAITQEQRLTSAQMLVDALVIKFPVLLFRLHQVMD